MAYVPVYPSLKTSLYVEGIVTDPHGSIKRSIARNALGPAKYEERISEASPAPRP
jgi:hypothetical protein